MDRDRFEPHPAKQRRNSTQHAGVGSSERRHDDDFGRLSARAQKTHGIREQEALRQIRELRARY